MSGIKKKIRSPCVGICSTTYGDLVCRGCRRFSHEIVGWNGYSEEQKISILERLKQIKKEVVSQHLLIANLSRFEALCEEVGFESVDLDEKKYAVLAYLVTKSEGLNFGGLEVKGLCEGSLDVSKLMSILESEMYARAQAHYERNFKIKV